MSVALYRKYRPKLFSEVTNQNHVKITLQNEILSDKLAHAYLFCGPRGTGKTTLARLLSKAVNCLDLQENAEPCNKCQSCLDIAQNKSLDIIEIDAASHTGVDNVRENIINNARFTPTNSKYKVFIIDEVHMLSPQAFNALLKTLEEPPTHVIFILATTEAHKVPVTIISRCQRFDFKKIIASELVERLRWIVSQEKIEVEEKVLEVIAKNSGGCVRDAESLLEQVLSLDAKKVTFEQAQLVLPRLDFDSLVDLFEKMIKKEAKQAIELVNTLVEDGVDIVQYNKHLIEFLRKILLYKVNGQRIELSSEMDEILVDKIVKLVENVSTERLVQIIEIFLEKKSSFRQADIIQLPLEIAILQVIDQADTISQKIEPVISKISASVSKPQIKKTSKILSEVKEDKSVSDVDKKKVEPVVESVQKIEVEVPSEELKTVVSESKVVVDNGSFNEEVENKKKEQNEVKTSEADIVKTKGGLSLTFNQVVSRWAIVVHQVKSIDSLLSMFLSVAKPLELEGNVLTLGFSFELQQKRVDIPKNLGIIENILKTEFGAIIKVKTVLDSEIVLDNIDIDDSQDAEVKVEQTETKDPLGKVLDSFGGSVVDKI